MDCIICCGTYVTFCCVSFTGLRTSTCSSVHLSKVALFTLEMCVPKLRWMPAQLIQRNMPNDQEAHRGPERHWPVSCHYIRLRWVSKPLAEQSAHSLLAGSFINSPRIANLQTSHLSLTFSPTRRNAGQFIYRLSLSLSLLLVMVDVRTLSFLFAFTQPPASSLSPHHNGFSPFKLRAIWIGEKDLNSHWLLLRFPRSVLLCGRGIGSKQQCATDEWVGYSTISTHRYA
jgi:hypothetical protein